MALCVLASCSVLSCPERVRSSRDLQIQVIPCTAWCGLEVLDGVAMWPIKPEQEKQGTVSRPQASEETAGAINLRSRCWQLRYTRARAFQRMGDRRARPHQLRSDLLCLAAAC